MEKQLLTGFEEKYIRLGQGLQQMTSLWQSKKIPGKHSDLLLCINT